jgi:hypothetical protein
VSDPCDMMTIPMLIPLDPHGRPLGEVMPYVPHTRVTFGGSLGTGLFQEQWVCGLSLGGEGTDATLTLPVQAELDAVATAIKNYVAYSGSGIGGVAVLLFVKFAVIDATGHYAGDPVLINVAATQGGSAGASHPFQISRVISLDTGRRGPTGRGRFFAPAAVGAIDSEGLSTVDQAQTAAFSAADMIKNVNNAVSGAARVVVASSKGYNTTVSSVRVGRVLDTVRSRRTSLQERYSNDEAVTP